MDLNNIQIPIFFVLLLTLSSFPLSLSRVPQSPPEPEPQDQAQAEPEPEPKAEGPSMADPNADPGLKDICKVAPEPDLCVKSYYVYTGEDHPDKSMTAQAVLRKELEVAKKMSMEYYTKCISVSSEFYGKNHRIYSVFGNCARMFVLGANSLISAKTALIKEHDIAKTKNEIGAAINQYKNCENTFRDLVEPPKLEAEHLYKMTDICMALANSMH